MGSARPKIILKHSQFNDYMTEISAQDKFQPGLKFQAFSPLEATRDENFIPIDRAENRHVIGAKFNPG
jgi:hypothetical protein